MNLVTRVTQSNTTFGSNDEVVAVDTSDGDVTVTISDLSGSTPTTKAPIIKNFKGTNDVIVTAGGQTEIDGQTSVTVEPGQSILLAAVHTDTAHEVLRPNWIIIIDPSPPN